MWAFLLQITPPPQICPDICISEIPDPVTLAIKINHHSRQVVAYEYRGANHGEVCFRYTRPVNIRSHPFCVSLISKDLTQHSYLSCCFPLCRITSWLLPDPSGDRRRTGTYSLDSPHVPFGRASQPDTSKCLRNSDLNTVVLAAMCQAERSLLRTKEGILP